MVRVNKIWKKAIIICICAGCIYPGSALPTKKAEVEDSVNQYDYIPDVPYELVEDRLKCIPSVIPLNLNERVYAFVNYFAVIDRDYTRMIMERTPLYFPIIEKYLKKYNLPDELKYLAIIESGLNPNAISRAGAVGLWQFMPGTGNYFKLHTDWYVDDRMDPYKATEAACQYLSQLFSIFNDWGLALAAYNAGPGNVRRAIRRSGYKKNFWDIYRYLPRETRGYVPQFLAMIYLLNNAEHHNLFSNHRKFLPESDTIYISQFLHVKTFAQQLNICLEEMQKLNPSIKWNALSKDVKNYPLRIPSDKYQVFLENQQVILDSAGRTGKKEIEYMARNTVGSTYGREKLVYKVRSGDVLGTIAQRYRVRVSDIRKWNRLSGNLIRVGQRLDIWMYPGTKPRPVRKLAKASPKSIPLLPSARVYQVQPGDTLWDISKMYQDLSIEKIKKLNNLKTNKIVPGQKLVIG